MVSSSRLLRALERSAVAHGCVPELTLLAVRDWASATFVGARCDVRATLAPGPAAADWIAALPQVDLPMPGQFASEARVIARQEADDAIVLTVEVLVLAE